MTTRERIVAVRQLLAARGESGSLYRLAKIMEVSPSTVGRWYAGGSEPRQRYAAGLAYLYRALTRAAAGDSWAERIARNLIEHPGLATGGHAGLAIAAGLGWLVSPA